MRGILKFYTHYVWVATRYISHAFLYAVGTQIFLSNFADFWSYNTVWICCVVYHARYFLISELSRATGKSFWFDVEKQNGVVSHSNCESKTLIDNYFTDRNFEFTKRFTFLLTMNKYNQSKNWYNLILFNIVVQWNCWHQTHIRGRSSIVKIAFQDLWHKLRCWKRSLVLNDKNWK